VSLQLHRNAAASLFVIPGQGAGATGLSQTVEEGVPLWQPLLSPHESAELLPGGRGNLRAVLSPEDGEPVRTVCAAYGCMARGTRACATHGRPLWQHVRRMSLDAKPQADKIRYLSTKNAAEHEEAASQLTPLEVDRRTEMRRRLRADQARAHSPALPLPRALSCAPARSLVLARSPACPVLLPPWP
jgi:hypothetical protein